MRGSERLQRMFNLIVNKAFAVVEDSQPATSSACSPSSVPPYDWSRTHQGETTSHHCFVIVTGCPSSNASTTSCVWWCIVVCTDGLHPTWSNLSIRLQLHIHELDSGRRSWGLWQYCARIQYLEIGHSLSQLTVRGTVCRSHFVRPSLLTASRETCWKHSYITLLSCLNIFVTLFPSFKLLGALIVHMGHLPSTPPYSWLILIDLIDK